VEDSLVIEIEEELKVIVSESELQKEDNPESPIAAMV
jgi:hypothetical protein